MRCRAIGSRTFTSKRNASPLVAFTNPSSTFIVVVFPAPLGPRKPKTSPARTCRFKSLTATFFPSGAEGALYSTLRFLSSTIACIIELASHDHKSHTKYKQRISQNQQVPCRMVKIPVGRSCSEQLELA